MASDIEDRLAALENWIKTEYGWAAKNWQIVAGACLGIGFIAGHVLWH